MPSFIALLRGINVGGHRLIRMADLRELCESLGFTSAETYVQSGNVVFDCRERSDAKVAAKLCQGIEAKFGFNCNIIVRSAADIKAAIEKNPFAGREGVEPGKLLVTFLEREPPAELRDKAMALRREPEEIFFNGRELYMYFPNGIGKSTTPLASIDRALKTPGTGRNWNTVLKLLEMSESRSRG